MNTRTLIVDPDTEYSEKELQGIREHLDPKCVYKISGRKEGGILVQCPIQEPHAKVAMNIGDAYISAGGGE